jgi:hypothetical protein
MSSITSSAFWKRNVTDIQNLGDDESARYLEETPRGAANRVAVIVLITSAISLTILNFGASTSPDWFISTLDALGLDSWSEWSVDVFRRSSNRQRNGLVFWGIGNIFAYVVPPILVIKFVLKDKISNYGTRVKGIWPHGKTYAILLALSIPFVIFASYTAAFQTKYPFYDLSAGEGLWPNMTMWWIIYGFQFMALEFFFRGFLVHGLKHRLGYLAIYVMAVPYNMLHFNKPVLEAVAAIGGAVVLGSLSLRSRSVWWGAWLHISIAATMDISALIHKGFLFS